MKKTITILLAFIIALSLAACGGGQTPNAPVSETTEVPETPEPTQEATPEPTINPYTVAEITTNEGQKETKTIDELIELYDANEAKFIKVYQGAKISFTGTVKSIKMNETVVANDGCPSGQNKIVFEEGWCLIIGVDNKGRTYYDLADYDVGDVLEVSTGIVGAPFDSDFVKGLSNNNRVLWLVGNENLLYDTYNNIPTVITKK